MDDFDSLRICPDCDCRFCFESAAEPMTADLWLVVVQCPNCWGAWRRTVNDIQLELFEHALDEDTHMIEHTVDMLALENAAHELQELDAEVARFAAALEANAILPMDF